MSRRILLADDSVTIQKVIELTFMDEDYEVTAVSNGDEAIALLDQLRPDFVIADVHMPGANGYAVCRRAKEVLPGVPVLLLVGTFEPFDEGQSRAAAADAFLKKPFDSQELLQLVEQLLGGRGSAASASAPAAAPEPFAAFEPSEPSEAAVFDFAAPLGGGDPVAEPIWGNLDVDAAGDAPAPPAPTAPADPWSASAPVWEADAPADEQVFELDADIEDLTLGDDSLLPGEAEPFRFTGDGESLEPVGGVEALPPDEAPFRFDPAPETALPFAEEEPFRFGEVPPVMVEETAADDGPEPFALETADLPEPLRFGGPVAVPPAADEQPFRFDDDPAAGPSAEERLGIPAAALPLVSGIDELEQRVHEHEAAPAFETADPLPPAEEALVGGFTAGTAEAAPAALSPAAPAAAVSASAATAAGRLSDEDVDRIARRLLELAGEKVVRDVAWEIVPDMAELVIKDRLRELEAQVE